MSYEIPGKTVGIYAADIDMSNAAVWQFAPVWRGPAANTTDVNDAPGNLALVAQGALTTPAFGILQNPCIQGEPGCVMTNGISKCIVATAITTIGQAVKLIAGGCAPASSGDPIDGYAHETGPVGSIIAIELVKNGKA